MIISAHGDITLFFVIPAGFCILGIVMAIRPRPVARWLATMNLRSWRDTDPFPFPRPSETRIRWLEAIESDPNHSPFMIWAIRGMGCFSILFALPSIGLSIAELVK